jgi:hypothetical protein
MSILLRARLVNPHLAKSALKALHKIEEHAGEILQSSVMNMQGET